MWRLFETNTEVLVHRGHLYLPVPLDPDIHQEMQTVLGSGMKGAPETAPLPGVLSNQGTCYGAGVSLMSLVENYPLLYPEAAEGQRRRFHEQYSQTGDLWGLALDPHLVTIIFHILPHFVRRRGWGSRRAFSEVEILDLIAGAVPVPRRYHQKAMEFLDTSSLEAALRRLQMTPKPPPPLPDALYATAALQAWWREHLEARWLGEERARLLRALEDRERWGHFPAPRLAVLLYLADTGSLELDGFGFSRMGKGREYRIYKRTGAFALQDFFGRLYLFPDCRVAVSTAGRLRPVVVEHYKHPFLRRYGSGQEICLGSDAARPYFSAASAIQALEEGINALFYSYDPRRRNGYYSLDEPPGKLRPLHFDDYRIPADHPLIVSGQVEVKNRAT